MPAWAIGVLAYMGLGLMIGLIEKDTRREICNILLFFPAILVLAPLIWFGSRHRASFYRNIPNPDAFRTLQDWRDANPDIPVRMLSAGRFTMIWQPRGYDLWTGKVPK